MVKRMLHTFLSRVPAQGRRLAISLGLAGSIAALGVMSAWPALSESPTTLTADEVARQFCVPLPTEAQVNARDVADEEISVQVPREDTSYGLTSPAVPVRLGDVVQVKVFTGRAGAAGVHGLSTIDAILPGESAVIKFRAIYSGRFPLHFHGVDGSHFELMAINIAADAGARAQN
jgi:hypothetical protein